jgi:Sulfotransferase family
MAHPYSVQVILDHYGKLKPDDVVQRLRYCSFVSVSRRYMYFEVPKAACTKMKEVLRSLEGASPLKLLSGGLRETRREMFVHARENVPLPSLVDLDNKTQREVLESPHFLRFTFVRNPYTRLLSAWKSKILLCEPAHQYVYYDIKGHLPGLPTKSLITFDEFVEYVASRCNLQTCDPHWRRQTDHIFFPALNFSHLGKIEQMSLHLRRFEQHLGLSHPILDATSNASGSTGPIGYNASLAHKVYSLYEKDFVTLGYERHPWPPGEQSQAKEPATVAIRDLNDEIIERNLIISLLYEERDRLRSDLQKISRLRTLKIANALLACREVPLRLLSNIRSFIQQRKAHRSSRLPKNGEVHRQEALNTNRAHVSAGGRD